MQKSDNLETNLQPNMNSFSVAFYNTENFFDVYDNPKKFDEDYSPTGNRKWTQERYANKVLKISGVISELGLKETGAPPLIVGLAEVESKRVLKDLVDSVHLKEFEYNYVHFESKDERGIDNALLYRREFFDHVESFPISNSFMRENGREDFSRDILYSKLHFQNNVLHNFVIHLPSRRDNDYNKEFRNRVLITLRKKVDELLDENPSAYILIMGDFNGNPTDMDAREILKTTEESDFQDLELYNSMLPLRFGKGSLKHEGKWILFDQMLFSKSFFKSPENFLKFKSVHIYQDKSVQDWDRRFKGSPFRTYLGTKYLGGYSDHFPIYAILNY